MKAKILTRAEYAATLERERQNRKPVAPTTRLKQWIKQHAQNKPTASSARREFANLFTVK